MAPGKRVTIADIARMAGVSPAPSRSPSTVVPV